MLVYARLCRSATQMLFFERCAKLSTFPEPTVLGDCLGSIRLENKCGANKTVETNISYLDFCPDDVGFFLGCNRPFGRNGLFASLRTCCIRSEAVRQFVPVHGMLLRKLPSIPKQTEKNRQHVRAGRNKSRLPHALRRSAKSARSFALTVGRLQFYGE